MPRESWLRKKITKNIIKKVKAELGIVYLQSKLSIWKTKDLPGCEARMLDPGLSMLGEILI